jgi:hypothetical protein
VCGWITSATDGFAAELSSPPAEFATSGRLDHRDHGGSLMSLILLAKLALIIWTVVALTGLAATTWLDHRQLAEEE